MIDNRELDTRIAKFLLVRNNIPVIIGGTLAAAFAWFIFLPNSIPSNAISGWFGFVVFWSSIRAIVLRHWHMHETTRDNVNRRIILMTFLACVMSSSFGIFGYYALNESTPFSNLLIVTILAGMVASATGTTSFLLPTYLFFVVPLLFPITIKLWMFQEQVYHWISALAIIFLAVCAGAARVVGMSITDSINIRFYNDELLENLQQEKQRAEEALKREAHANQAKSKFLAAASHDLRQPLHSLRLFTATLELQTRDTSHKTLVSQIDSSVKSLEDLFNALLDISKLDAGTFSVNKQDVRLRPLMEQIEMDFLPLAEEKEIEFECIYEDCFVYTDLVLLERLIRNLISNAIRYTSSGSVRVVVEVQEAEASISVMDTGPGISTEDQARVFEEFVQLNNNKEAQGQGIGLGLSIVKRIAVLLEMPITLASKPGVGANFSVKIPVVEAPVGNFENTNELVYEGDIDSIFVLVIDDENDVCLAVEGLLETWGCVVMTATSGDAAILQLEEIGEVPDVILSDYRLRDGETGGDAIRGVRDHVGLEIPAIILTGDIAPDRLQAIKELGYPMLHKPCEPDALKQVLSSQAPAKAAYR